MSATPPARNARSTRRAPTQRPRNAAEARLRRREAREARRRRGLLRMDVGLGVLAAIVLLLATPGVAFAAIIALLVLIVCAVSVAIEHRRSRRAGRVGRAGHADHPQVRRRTAPRKPTT